MNSLVMINLKKLAALSCAGFMLSACGGGSDVGNQEDVAPQAVAAVFGANANTQGTVDVRSGSDVLLSGQSSEGFDDPILEFDWQQINVDDYQVTLYERTSNAVVFEAPEIPITDTDGVTLDFQLTVTDADGATATDTVQVVVKPALDANHFLSRPENNEEFIIVVAADSGTTLTQPIPVSIEITQTVSWIDRENRPHQLVLNSETLSGVVPQNSNSDLSDPFNLYFRKAIPLLDIDDVNQNFQNELRDQRLEFENVDTAQFQLSICAVAAAASGYGITHQRRQLLQVY